MTHLYDKDHVRQRRPRPALRPTRQDLIAAQEKYAARRLRDSLPLRIETQRLVLRAPMRADAHDLAALADNIEIASRLSRLPHPYRLDHALGFIEDIATGPSERPYAITLKDRLIGVIGLTFLEPVPEIGYWLGQPYWGQGYATEAGMAMLAAADATGRFSRYQARALISNDGSRNVLEKLGFVATGVDVDKAGTNAGKPIHRFIREVAR